MGNTDSIPVVSQTKSLVQAIAGDEEGARRTQENFSRQCPIVSQARSLVEVSMGDEEAARETQRQFGQGMVDLVDRTPGIGHIKGGIQYACGDKDGGDKAMVSATRGLFFGPIGMATYDIVNSAIPDKIGDQHISTVNVGETRIAKEFGSGSTNLSEWTKHLDGKMAVICHEGVKALNQRKTAKGGEYLKWDDVLNVFCSCAYIARDDRNTVHIKDSLEWDEQNFFKFDGSPEEIRKRKIVTWLKNLMDKHGELSVFKDTDVFNDGTVDRLAGIASQSGATITDPVTAVAKNESHREKVIEISVIRFPEKWNSKFKLYRLALFAWSRCSRILFSQHDDNGIEIEYDSYEFKPDVKDIDERHAAEAKIKLSDPKMFDF